MKKKFLLVFLIIFINSQENEENQTNHSINSSNINPIFSVEKNALNELKISFVKNENNKYNFNSQKVKIINQVKEDYFFSSQDFNAVEFPTKETTSKITVNFNESCIFPILMIKKKNDSDLIFEKIENKDENGNLINSIKFNYEIIGSDFLNNLKEFEKMDLYRDESDINFNSLKSQSFELNKIFGVIYFSVFCLVFNEVKFEFDLKLENFLEDSPNLNEDKLSDLNGHDSNNLKNESATWNFNYRLNDYSFSDSKKLEINPFTKYVLTLSKFTGNIKIEMIYDDVIKTEIKFFELVKNISFKNYSDQKEVSFLQTSNLNFIQISIFNKMDYHNNIEIYFYTFLDTNTNNYWVIAIVIAIIIIIIIISFIIKKRKKNRKIRQKKKKLFTKSQK